MMSGPGAMVRSADATMNNPICMGFLRKQKKPRTKTGLFRGRRALFPDRLDRHHGLARRTVLRVLHVAGGRREQRVVLADADVHSGMEARAALADEDRPRVHELAAEGLEAEALAL